MWVGKGKKIISFIQSMLKKGSSLALSSPGVDISEGWDNSTIVWWSPWSKGTISFTQNLEDVRSALGWGRKGEWERSFISKSLICSQSTFFCVSKDSAGAFMQERAGDRTATSGRGQYCHISTAVPHTAPHWTQFIVMKSFVSKMSVPVSGQALHCLFIKIT